LIAVTRCYGFPAAHVLHHPDLPDAENRRIYGKCANPHGHGHDYGLQVTVTGRPDPSTGHVIDPERLDAIVREVVLQRFAHRTLNDDPLFARRVPTAENIACVVHERLREPVAQACEGRLLRVRVVETARNHFDYGAMP
jgi:6-pyruvoyltetrahydropterin/6-carboxytetrahydropterin synthase